MKKYPYVITGALAFVAFGCALFGDGAKIAGLITGPNVFVSSKDLEPGTFRKITVPDLPAPMPPPAAEAEASGRPLRPRQERCRLFPQASRWRCSPRTSRLRGRFAARRMAICS